MRYHLRQGRSPARLRPEPCGSAERRPFGSQGAGGRGGPPGNPGGGKPKGGMPGGGICAAGAWKTGRQVSNNRASTVRTVMAPQQRCVHGQLAAGRLQSLFKVDRAQTHPGWRPEARWGHARWGHARRGHARPEAWRGHARGAHAGGPHTGRAHARRAHARWPCMYAEGRRMQQCRVMQLRRVIQLQAHSEAGS